MPRTCQASLGKHGEAETGNSRELWTGGNDRSLEAMGCTIKRDAHVLYLAAHDPRMPWYAKALAITVAAYAASPIDLMPDFVPVNHFPLVGGSI
jgi:uncharacterized membrane protein YkvA (DUF1232 family)